jgi:hypothetical protein
VRTVRTYAEVISLASDARLEDKDGTVWDAGEVRLSDFRAFKPWILRTVGTVVAEPKAEENPPEPAQRVAAEAIIKALKPRMDLVPMDAVVAVAEVLTFGAQKYADDSWKREPFTSATYLSAEGRHWGKMAQGEVYDDESNLLHAAHKACNALMQLWHEMQKHPVRKPPEKP